MLQLEIALTRRDETTVISQACGRRLESVSLLVGFPLQHRLGLRPQAGSISGGRHLQPRQHLPPKAVTLLRTSNTNGKSNRFCMWGHLNFTACEEVGRFIAQNLWTKTCLMVGQATRGFPACVACCAFPSSACEMAPPFSSEALQYDVVAQ